VDHRLVRGREAIKVKKTVVETGGWKVVTGKAKMSGSAFPIARSNRIQLGRNWHWRVDTATADGVSYRLLTAFNADLQEYRAWLTTPRGDSHLVVGQLEFHGSHPGWHCHVICGELDDAEAGQSHSRFATRLPDGGNRHRRQSFDMTESRALELAFNFFRITGTPDGAMI
jgi:hypothetical protein